MPCLHWQGSQCAARFLDCIAYKFDNNYALFLIGASAPLGSTLTGFISVSATAGNGTGNYQAFTVGIRAPV